MSDDIPEMRPSAEERAAAAEKTALKKWDDENHKELWKPPTTLYRKQAVVDAIDAAFRDGVLAERARSAARIAELEAEVARLRDKMNPNRLHTPAQPSPTEAHTEMVPSAEERSQVALRFNPTWNMTIGDIERERIRRCAAAIEEAVLAERARSAARIAELEANLAAARAQGDVLRRLREPSDADLEAIKLATQQSVLSTLMKQVVRAVLRAAADHLERQIT